ncbi:hypothetical protein llap_14008 [Limosa lapponica baueri]|uniref:Uncharacterized protein n=1 Tax=Limosa lapponica baueri TaxID=1758121 RepID=A0A2I0TPJ2_LIMLA|nr:hypothetical protein llap_14008 [Limosa lapponica baueri]
MLQAPNHLRSPLLYPLQQFPVLLELGSPERDTALQMGSHQGRAEGEDNLPRPAGHTLPDAPQDAIGLLGHKDTLLAHGRPVVHQDSQVFLLRGVLQQVSPQPVLVQGVISPQVQHLTLALVEFHQVPLYPTLQPVQVSLYGGTAFWCVSHPSQFCVISKLAGGTFHPFIAAIDEYVEEDWTQY